MSRHRSTPGTAGRNGATELPLPLADWLPRQRWFAAKGTGPVTLEQVGGLRFGDAADEVGVETLLVGVRTPDGSTVYQVPLTYRRRPVESLAHALVGPVDLVGRGTRWVYDGPHDPAFVRALLHVVAGGEVHGDGGPAAPGSGPGSGTARGRLHPGGLPPDPDAPAYVLSGEQSNTSLVVGVGGPAPVIVKLFRVLAPGDNPDVVVQSTLAAAGCERVPQPVGRVTGRWPAPDGGEPVRGHLAYASEFLGGSEDAWRAACRSVDTGTAFGAAAYAIGGATAQVHAVLAATLPTSPATSGLLGDLADSLLARVDWAVAQAPVLASRAAAARTVLDGVRRPRNPLTLQRVHGDYHLGQVLHSPTRGWVLLDFEGEPLRPLADRTAPDLALRDVAGMLRSFDYAARHATVGLPADDPRVAAADSWAQACRTAFLDGYTREAGHDPRDEVDVLRALELDKALYEVVYETRNRPTWVGVPLHAVNRLLPQRDS